MQGIGRLADECQRPQPEHPAHRLFLNVRRYHDDLAPQLLLAKSSQNLVAVHVRHGQIKQQDVHAAFTNSFQRLATAGSLKNVQRPRSRQRAQQLLARQA